MSSPGTLKEAPVNRACLLDRAGEYLLLTLVLSLPFEIRLTLFGLSNLQWLFVVAAIVSAPGLIRKRRALVREPLVIAVVSLALVYWTSALLSEALTINAVKSAVRVTTGVVLVCMALGSIDKKRVLHFWCVSSVAAAVYGIVDYFGFGYPHLFRMLEFWQGSIQRLSGSFEYPNTAATFFAMSLPLVWMVPRRMSLRLGGVAILWSALILTYSRGAFVAAVGAYVGLWVMTRERRREWRSPLAFVSVAVLIFTATTLFEPMVVQRLSTVSSDNPIAATYETNFNILRQRPGVSDEMEVTLRNVGLSTWNASGRGSMVLSYRWFDTIERRSLEDDPIETPLPSDVKQRESVTLDASFRTPARPGSYLLIWDMKSNQGYFSRMGVIPGIIEVEIESGVQRSGAQGDVSRWYRPDRETEPSIDASVSRMDLWKAAVRMALDHPILGVGPDNFRLMYGTYLGYSRWDSKVRSNSLYLELAATCGLLGLLAFGLVAGSIKWTWGPVSVALAVFLVHGLVDVFLLTTPIYFGFWILVGLSGAIEPLSEN